MKHVVQQATARLAVSSGSRSENAAPLSFELGFDFLNGLKDNVRVLSDWTINGKYLTRNFTADEVGDEKFRHRALKDALDGLAAAGWKVRSKDRCDYFLDRNGDWPITLRDLGRLEIWVRGDREETLLEIPGHKAIADALKKAGRKFKERRVIGSGLLSFNVDRQGTTAASIAKLVQTALDADMRVHRPAYMSNPWSKSGKTKLFPSEKNSYIVDAGDIIYRIYLDYGKNPDIVIVANWQPSSYRRTK